MKFLLKIFVFMAIILVGKFTKEKDEKALVIQAPPQKEASFSDYDWQHANIRAILRDREKMNIQYFYSF